MTSSHLAVKNVVCPLFCLLAIVVSMLLSSVALAVQSKITLKVVDDTGQVMEGATAGMSLCHSKGFGAGWGCNTKTVDGLTDQTGLVTVRGSSDSGPLGVHASKDGHYSSGHRVNFKSSGSVWTPWNPHRIDPWNPTITLELKRILNPIPLYARKVELEKDKALPTDGRKRAFDLQRGDWIAPYGEGTTSDFIFELVSKWENDDKYEATLRLRFANEGDGIASVLAMPHQGSQLRLPHYAPESGYEPRITEHIYRDLERPRGQQMQTGIREDQNYFFRVRTIKDSSGKIQRALYGKIHGDIQFWDNGVIRFTYYFNPNFNDRNMEFDPARNLFADLPLLKNVTEP